MYRVARDAWLNLVKEGCYKLIFGAGNDKVQKIRHCSSAEIELPPRVVITRDFAFIGNYLDFEAKSTCRRPRPLRCTPFSPESAWPDPTRRCATRARASCSRTWRSGTMTRCWWPRRRRARGVSRSRSSGTSPRPTRRRRGRTCLRRRADCCGENVGEQAAAARAEVDALQRSRGRVEGLRSGGMASARAGRALEAGGLQQLVSMAPDCAV